ncbi:MAG: penicillin-binding protein 2 [Caldilineaceae bacterium]|nr:penicillin-binding protein 2 [Caldilineaceae bacterium]
MTASIAPDPQRSGSPIGDDTLTTSEIIQKPDTWRFWLLVFTFVVLAFSVIIPLILHQALQFGQAPQPGVGHQGQSPRGVIVDRDGALLAGDYYFYQVTTTPKNITSDAERQELAQQLELLAGIPYAKTLDLLTRFATFSYIELAKAIPMEAAQRIMAEQERVSKEKGMFPISSVSLFPAPKRYYPEARLASHIVGMVAVPDKSAWIAGFYGLEGYYDNYLRKRDGVGLTTTADADLLDLPVETRKFLPSAAGKDLVLTIDRTIQWIAEDELQKGIRKYRAQSGTIIVMDPRTGAVLALANFPNYDPNRLSERDVAALQNPAISAQYEPGSVFKVVIAAAVLDSGLIKTTDKLTDTGSIAVGDRVILNSSRASWGQVDMTEALARSLNVITAQWSLLLGADRFYKYMDRFGFGQVSEIDLAGEVYGVIKRPGDDEWSMADLGTNSFGQGLAVTPIQMANAMASLANGGKLMRPYIVAARVADGKVQYTEPTVQNLTVKPETAAILTDVLVKVVDLGNTAAGVAGYRIAGKSGTAQIPTKEGYTEDETIVTFAGYAPADDPQVLILVKLDRPDPNISPWADYTAAPVFAQVARRVFDHLNIPPDDVRLGKIVAATE